MTQCHGGHAAAPPGPSRDGRGNVDGGTVGVNLKHLAASVLSSSFNLTWKLEISMSGNLKFTDKFKFTWNPVVLRFVSSHN